MNGEFTITLGQGDFVAAYWFYTRWLWLWRRMIIALLLVAVVYSGLMIAIDVYYSDFKPAELLAYARNGAIYALVVSMLLTAVTLVTLPRRLKRLYVDLRVAGRETKFEFDAGGLHTSNCDGSANLGWDRFKHRIENDRFLMLVLSRWSFIIIPKAQVAEDMLVKLRSAASAGGVVMR